MHHGLYSRKEKRGSGYYRCVSDDSIHRIPFDGLLQATYHSSGDDFDADIVQVLTKSDLLRCRLCSSAETACKHVRVDFAQTAHPCQIKGNKGVTAAEWRARLGHDRADVELFVSQHACNDHCGWLITKFVT